MPGRMGSRVRAEVQGAFRPPASWLGHDRRIDDPGSDLSQETAVKYCRCCGADTLISLGLPESKGGPWSRCLSCCSDSSAEAYDGGRYAADYLAAEVAATGGEAARDLAIKENMEW